MAGAPANPSFLRFSTDELPERERLPAFQDVFGRAIAKVDFEPLAGTHLRIQAKVRALPGLGAAIGAFSPIQGRRTRELIADGNDDITLFTCPEGGSIVSQCGRGIDPPWRRCRARFQLGHALDEDGAAVPPR